MNTIKITTPIAAFFILTAIGCTSERHAKQADPMTPQEVAAELTYDEKLAIVQHDEETTVEINYIAIGVDDTLAEMCGMEKTRAFFKDDSAAIIPDTAKRLDGLAACMTEGIMKNNGEKIVITGHTDPDGDVEHNLELGRSRALNVGRYLLEKGVSSNRLITKSAGEKKADDDQSEYADRFDRKVSIRLLN